MRIPLFQVDAFARRLFEGNPAAVCPLDSWLENEVLQAIAAENNLSETAFFVPNGANFELRWFTPAAEVDLCGHATLASAHVLFEILGHAESVITFLSRSGPLQARRDGSLVTLDFPAIPLTPCAPPGDLIAALGVEPGEVYSADDYVAVLDSETAVRALAPDMAMLGRLERRGVCVTAQGRGADFVSRFFAPKLGVPEDPVTGSAHCELAPYWAGRLGKSRLVARQLSTRGGEVRCELRGDRVLLTGHAVIFMQGEIEIPG